MENSKKNSIYDTTQIDEITIKSSKNTNKEEQNDSNLNDNQDEINSIEESKNNEEVLQIEKQGSEIENNNTNNNTSNNTTNNNTSNNIQVPTQPPTTPTVSNNFLADVEKLIYQKVNIERRNAGVGELSYSDTMQKYARIKSQDMGDRGYFDHRDLEGNLITIKMQQDGIGYSAWAENIAYIGGISDSNSLASTFMNNWMASQGHRENILSPNYVSIGVGVYKIGNTVYATQEFYR